CDSLIDTVTIDGFTLCNGGGPNYFNSRGGGVFSTYSNVIIKNNTIRDNWAYGWCQDLDAGAGIYIYGGYALIENNIITGNVVYGEAAKNNTFTSKGKPWGKGEGGVGIYVENAKVIIKNNIIQGNRAIEEGDYPSIIYGGGISCIECSSAVIFNNIIDNNYAYGYRDGQNNYYGGGGAGIYCTPPARIINNTFVHNKAISIWNTASLGHGGGIYCDKGSMVNDSIIIRDNIITFNLADTGGGIFCSDSLDLSKVLIGYNDFYFNMYDELFNVPDGVSNFSWYGPVFRDSFYNINIDPWFVIGPSGNYYQKDVVDCGDFIVGQEFAGMGNTADGKPDTGWVDLGYHYKVPIGIDENSFTRYSNTPIVECYPNPFIKATEIRAWGLGVSEKQEVKIYDITGKLVEEARFFADAQNDRLKIGKNLLPGIYFVKIKGYKPIKVIKLGGVK
ncbi:MAG: right-handed parallel beta-helix repeat-containing protein, partial [Candidatus Stahlbacteria bacterium]|nr:right-handed parallel beta-helix repeat-containing protein [Candidatus Stahlbacteria bacterium]